MEKQFEFSFDKKHSDPDYFAANYEEARARFRAIGEKIAPHWLGASRFSFQVPSPTDSDLTVDYLSLPANGVHETLIVITSGVHGPEAPTGHALQMMFLTELLPLVRRENVGLLFVHALNPYGYKYLRRNTENNVNLNRNFGLSPATFEHRNDGYERLSEAIESHEPAGSLTLTTLETIKILASQILQKKFTPKTLNQALCEGQYRHPAGVEYGGKTWEPQTADFLFQLNRHMENYKETIVCDLHTGLGERFDLHLLPPDDDQLKQPELQEKIFGTKSDLFKYTLSDSTGFYRTMGDMNTIVPTLVREGGRALALTFEFGTLGNSQWQKLQMFSRMLLENRGFNYGYKSQEAKDNMKQLMLETFAPSDRAWRTNAISKTRKIWTEMLRRLSV